MTSIHRAQVGGGTDAAATHVVAPHVEEPRTTSPGPAASVFRGLFGRRLRDLREQHYPQWSRSDFCHAARVDLATFSRVENGQIQPYVRGSAYSNVLAMFSSLEDRQELIRLSEIERAWRRFPSARAILEAGWVVRFR